MAWSPGAAFTLKRSSNRMQEIAAIVASTIYQVKVCSLWVGLRMSKPYE
jgi:hypothetical protein